MFVLIMLLPYQEAVDDFETGPESQIRLRKGDIHEASRVPDSLYLALRPMLLVSDGDVWLLSTPNGKSGFFYEAFMNGAEHGGSRSRISRFVGP